MRRLEGMFALAIWDGRRRELFLARDRIGVKPLYYAHQPGGLVFGSEIKALLEHPAVARDLDEAAFFDYLTFAFTPPPATMYRGISKLAPAERMIVRSDGSIERSCYWSPFSPDVAAEVREMSESEMVQRVRDLLRESIRKRMMSDVPFGVFLSGGVDSSANVALMAELIDRAGADVRDRTRRVTRATTSGATHADREAVRNRSPRGADRHRRDDGFSAAG